MSQLDRYATDIDSYFGAFKSHPAVLLAKKLAAENGIGFDAVMAMAVYLSPPPSLTPPVPFTATIPESRWGARDANLFTSEIQQFYRDTKFQVFFEACRALYLLAKNRFHEVLGSFDTGWFSDFYGVPPPARFHLVIGLNNGGGNYGPRVAFSDGRQEFYAIIGNWTKDPEGDLTFGHSYLPTVIHEFNHSFINPLVDQNARLFTALEHVYVPVARQMQAQAYATPRVMLYESLVRTRVIRYLEAKGQPQSEIRNIIRTEEQNGFVWTDQLYTL